MYFPQCALTLIEVQKLITDVPKMIKMKWKPQMSLRQKQPRKLWVGTRQQPAREEWEEMCLHLPHMLLYFHYSCTAHTRYFLCYSPLIRLISTYYKCKMKKVITFFSRDLNCDIPNGFLSLWNQFHFFSSNCKSFWTFCFYWDTIFKVKDRYKISRHHPLMEMRHTTWCRYLNLIYLQDLKSILLYFNLGSLVP